MIKKNIAINFYRSDVKLFTVDDMLIPCHTTVNKTFISLIQLHHITGLDLGRNILMSDSSKTKCLSIYHI